MDVEILERDDVFRVTVKTRKIDLSQAKILERIVLNLPGNRSLLSIDLKKVDGIDDGGLRYLKSVFSQVEENDCQIKIINLKKKLDTLVS